MSTLLPNSFSSYDLTLNEQLIGSVLTNTQIEVIQNEIALLAEEKLQLKLNPDNPQQFIQRESYMRGQIDQLQFTLAKSTSAVEQLNSPEYTTEEVVEETTAIF